MRAAVLTDDHTFVVEQVPDPTPGPGDLVVRVEACGICGSDLKAHGHMPGGIVMGHEFCGEVVAVGTDLSGRWREGELLAALPLTACGRCRWCLADDAAHCETFDPQGVGGAPGGFAEYVRVDAGSAVRLRPDVGDFGALVEPLAVGLHTVATGRIGPGDRVLVIGGGNVGSAVSHLGPALRRGGGRRQRPVDHPPRHRRPLRRHRRARPGRGPTPVGLRRGGRVRGRARAHPGRHGRRGRAGPGGRRRRVHHTRPDRAAHRRAQGARARASPSTTARASSRRRPRCSSPATSTPPPSSPAASASTAWPRPSPTCSPATPSARSSSLQPRTSDRC